MVIRRTPIFPNVIKRDATTVRGGQSLQIHTASFWAHFALISIKTIVRFGRPCQQSADAPFCLYLSSDAEIERTSRTTVGALRAHIESCHMESPVHAYTVISLPATLINLPN